MTHLAGIRALATDYDRTLTDPDLHLEGATVDALRTARKRGLKVIVISGRDLRYLVDKLHGAADAFVAENGCFMAFPHADDHGADVASTSDVLARYRTSPTFKEPFRVREVLEDAGLGRLEYGDALVSCDIGDEARVRELLDGHAVDFIPNRDRLMLLPPGVDKAMGLEATLATMGLTMQETAAAGDGENDIVMMEAAGHAVAVDNALPDVKKVADHVTQAPGGRGLAEWLDAWARAREGAAPDARRRA